MAEISQKLGEALAQLHSNFASSQSEAEGLKKLSLDALLSRLEVADSENLRALLPYVSEKLAESAHRCCFDKLVLALQKAEWRGWSREEQLALEGFFAAQWQHILEESAPVGIESLADNFLAAVTKVMDIQAFLDAWLQSRAHYAVAHMASVVVYGKKQVEKLGRSMSQARVLQRIEAAFWDCRSDEEAALFSKAAEILRSDEKVLA